MDLKEVPKINFERHPWEIARLEFFKKIMVKNIKNREIYNILDVGAGDSWFSQEILSIFSKRTIIICFDSSYDEIPTYKNNNIFFSKILPNQIFQAAFLMDVLEHVNDDESFLMSVLERVEKNGIVLICVPAWNCLMSNHDHALGHYRRYNPQKAKQLLVNSGLQILKSGGLFHWPLAVRALIYLKEKVQKPSKISNFTLEWKMGKMFSITVQNLLFMDNCLSLFFSNRNFNLPGLSWWALCIK